MILIRFHDICSGKTAYISSLLINIKLLYFRSPRLITAPISKIGQLLLAARTKIDSRIIESNLIQIMGLSENQAKLECKQFRQNRSARIVLDQLFKRKYYKRYSIEKRYLDGSTYPEAGCLFALTHTVEPYILPAVIGGMVADHGEKDVYILRKPQSQQETQQFDALAKWTGAYDIGSYLDPSESKSVKAAIRSLKSGKKLLSYIDMPAQFGRSPSVQFFGRKAWLALGAVDLARIAKVPIYLCHFERHETDAYTLVLKLKRIETNQPDVSQKVANRIEYVIRHSPSSWDFLASLRSYFYHPGDV